MSCISGSLALLSSSKVKLLKHLLYHNPQYISDHSRDGLAELELEMIKVFKGFHQSLEECESEFSLSAFLSKDCCFESRIKEVISFLKVQMTKIYISVSSLQF